MIFIRESFYAHSRNDNGSEHGLKEHLGRTAEIASAFSNVFCGGDFAGYLGLFHDLGKYHPEFQEYLLNPERKSGPNHSAAGAIHIAGLSGSLQFLSILLACHHTGLQSPPKIKSRLRKDKKEKQLYEELLQYAKKDNQELFNLDGNEIIKSLPEQLRDFGSAEKCRRAEFCIRMLFSCLVDADYLDTEAHFSPESSNSRSMKKHVFIDMYQRFQENQEELMKRNLSPLNSIRREIYEACLTASSQKPGIFRLPAPTGSGKTRASLAFALNHCISNKMERIIVSIPYTSIIEQTSNIYKDILGMDCVLEHHNLVDFDYDNELESRLKLASENWDYPLIVTTNVQLLESLFARKTSRCRKIHNIAKSVIVFDEVQTLPAGLLQPTLDVLQTLVDEYGVTILLCTATQPTLEEQETFSGLKNIVDVLPDAGRYFRELKRVEYEYDKIPWNWERIADEICSSKQALCIMNTKKDASAVLNELRNRDLEEETIFHLSTSMCAAHRSVVLEKVRKLLDLGEQCYLVSTQVVEAGVDIDFPLVLRALGPLDRIVQASGRCNREGKLGYGRTVIFIPEEGSTPPGEYKSGAYEAKILLEEEGWDLHKPELYQRYFRRLYQDVDTDKFQIQKMREIWDFEGVAHDYRLIREDTVSAIINYQPETDFIFTKLYELKSGFGSPRMILRKLQPFTVSIYRNKVRQFQNDGLLEPVIEDSLYLWKGGYDNILGISTNGIEPGSLCI